MIKIGTRSSKLALYQSNLVKDKLSNIYPELDFLLIQIKTKGDKIQDRNLDRALDKGFFVKEIQEQLLKNRGCSMEKVSMVSIEQGVGQNFYSRTCASFSPSHGAWMARTNREV